MTEPEIAIGSDTQTADRKWLAAAAFIAVLGLVGWGARALLQGDTESTPPGTANVVFTLHLETFVINLADPDERAYLRAGIDLGLNHAFSEKPAEGGPSIAVARDAILEVLAQGTSDELVTAAGKTKLKNDLLKALRQRDPSLGVEDVYFTEFLIQR